MIAIIDDPSVLGVDALQQIMVDRGGGDSAGRWGAMAAVIRTGICATEFRIPL